RNDRLQPLESATRIGQSRRCARFVHLTPVLSDLFALEPPQRIKQPDASARDKAKTSQPDASARDASFALG
ncbi:MAG: hypothetical protein AAFN70_14520, partial [Planctomycetota bacterium]